MGVPSIVYKWKSLRTLYIAVFLMNITGCAIMVVFVLTAAVKLHTSGMRDYLDLAVPGAAFFWPWLIILTAFSCAAIYAIGFKVCLHLKYANAESSLRLNDLLLTHCTLCFLSAIFEIGLGGVWIHQVMNIDRRLETGILESMREYPIDLTAKKKVDTMQLELSCCGSGSFEDWLDLEWLQAPESGDRNESPSAASKGVPFSCCVTETLAPCVHHGVGMPSDVYKLDRRLTISRIGCRAKLLSQTLHYGGLMIIALVSLSTYQMILAVLSRLLQTAHSNALCIGSGRSRYLAWIFGSSPSSGKYDWLVDREVAKIPLHRERVAEHCSPSKGPKENCTSKTVGDTPLQNSPFTTRSATGVLGEQGGPSYCRGSAETHKQTSTSGTCTKAPTSSPPSSGNLRESCTPADGTAGNEITPAVKSIQFQIPDSDLYVRSTKDWGGPSEESHLSTGHDQVRLDRFEDCPKEDQLRLRKFCKDLSAEYESSPCSKLRFYSNERPGVERDVRCSWSRDVDSGQQDRNEDCCWYNPADSYSRFRGSVQDTVMRRTGQIPPGPAPIPLAPMDQRRWVAHGTPDIPGIPHRACRQRHLVHPRPIGPKPSRPAESSGCPYGGNNYCHHHHHSTGGSFKQFVTEVDRFTGKESQSNLERGGFRTAGIQGFPCRP